MAAKKKASPAKSAPVRIGIIGLGRAGWGMQTSDLRKNPNFEIAAVCDIDEKRVEAAKMEFGCAGYADYRQFVKDPNLELVSVATRSCDHAKHAIAALNAGKSVMIEKPMAMRLSEADRILAAAEKSPGKLIVRHNRRFDPDFVHIKEIVDSGKLGDVARIKLYRHQYQRRDDWQTIKEFGGGQLLNWGPHLIDHALQFLGYSVKRIFARLNRVAAVGDAEDDVKVMLEGQSGLVVDIEISGGDAIGGENTYKVVGTKGGLTANRKEIRLKYLKRKPRPIQADRGTPPWGAGFGRGGGELEWAEETIAVGPKRKIKGFWDCVYDTIRRGEPFPVSLQEAREVVRVTDLILRGSGF
ncbi:MAG: putative oxidoreductase YdgJ [candidate division BRC1 bacterium ADurb.BinA364]|nr:MAG: putative oxidoreductase YdgJ [candidate division BRC1 bacterium ADurb.BinA364]